MPSATTIDVARYRTLVASAMPVVIENDREHRRLLSQIDELMVRGEERSREETRLLTLLARLVQDYEARKYRLGRTASPLDVLLHVMEARSVSHKDVWHLFGSRGVASEVLNGKRSISKTQAKKLAEFFHVTPDVFL